MQRVAIITGAGSGIGRAAAVALSRRGFSLGLAGRRLSDLNETAGMCDGEAWCEAVDVRHADEIARFFSTAAQRWSRLDLLFNNAGTNIAAKPIHEQSTGDLSDVITTNLLGAIFCAREAFSWMSRQSPQGGRIINNGSVSAYAPRPFSPAYTAAKHGVTGLTKSLNLDGWKFGVTCCQIDIGNAAVARTEQIAKGVLQANGTVASEPRIDVELVARQVADLADLPSDAVIPFLTIMPNGMPLYGRG
ncbi:MULTISPECIES: SDR family NAD(P)-dependent oxidoreductase [unclassified Rhizobium]|uniref:SDR family oxidoreductase n=1 Tax=unclassified Rhizobium TaxID=2613769 RepID=UPI001FD8C648|nr:MULTISPECIES: SDR family NAD(P)-dependent oxidoreductase [unclassified Rhizobium]